MNNAIWAEKYRPEVLEDFICSDKVKLKFQEYIDNQSIDHLLLYSPPGCGKTSLAKILTTSIECDVLYINASDERGIDTLRDKIKNFAMSMGNYDLKICILDEADGLSIHAMQALRPIMEFTSSHTRFILTANYPQKIIDPIKSRCQMFEFKSFSKKQVVKRLLDILGKEGIEYELEDVVNIAKYTYPDIRLGINTLQRSITNKKLVLEKTNLSSNNNVKIFELLKEKDWEGLKNHISEEPVMYEDAYKFLFNEIETIVPDYTALLVIQDRLHKHGATPDPEMNFKACILELMDLIK